jgi:3'-phosphoadenosine 5'-phosphosulfate sulfotransferase (PAPS reductase)/FAD synthetase
MKKISCFAAKIGVQMRVEIAHPALLDSWGPKVLGGRSLPSFPNNNSDCSTDWKIKPMQQLRKRILPQWGNGNEVVTLTGSRFSESVARGRKMQKRGETVDAPFRNKDGDLVFSPLALWTDDLVWELLGLVRAGVYESYTDAVDVIAAYADAGPTSCALINDEIAAGASPKGGCGARFGCHQCQMVRNDASMDNLLESDPQYEFMKGLAALRKFVAATQNDVSRRLWVGRTIKEGYIAIRPDVYSPAMMRELFRYAVTLDVIEEDESFRLGIEPRFRLVPADHAIAIDYLWSLNGHWDGFAAVSDYLEIWNKGVRYAIPETPLVGSEQFPEPRFLRVGSDWAQACGDSWGGMRDPFAVAMLEGCMTEVTYGKSKPVTFWDVTRRDIDEDTGKEVEAGFTIDPESLFFFFEYEAERLVADYQSYRDNQGRGFTARWYLQFGLIKISSGQMLRHNEALKRTAFKRLIGCNGSDVEAEKLHEISVGWDEVEESVQRAFLRPTRLAALEGQKRVQQARQAQGDLFA